MPLASSGWDAAAPPAPLVATTIVVTASTPADKAMDRRGRDIGVLALSLVARAACSQAAPPRCRPRHSCVQNYALSTVDRISPSVVTKPRSAKRETVVPGPGTRWARRGTRWGSRRRADPPRSFGTAHLRAQMSAGAPPGGAGLSPQVGPAVVASAARLAAVGDGSRL